MQKHMLAEFDDIMALGQSYMKHLIEYALQNCAEDLKFFERTVEAGLLARLQKALAEPFARMTYTEAIEMLLEPEHLAAGQFKTEPYWGIDLDAEHECYLTEKVFNGPLILTDYPKEIKAFCKYLSLY